MKEETIIKLLKSENREDIALGAEYAWKFCGKNKLKLKRFLVENIRPGDMKRELEVYIGKEVNIVFWGSLEISVYDGIISESPVIGEIIRI